jgi:GTP cyclohydrolase I
MNILEHMPLWYGRASFGYMPKNGIVGFSGRTVSNFLRNLQIDFQSDCTSSQIYQLANPPAMQECSSFSISSQHVLSLEF